MAIYRRASSQALVLAGVLLAGCSMQGTEGVFTTGSLASAKADPACVALASEIEKLRKAGIPDKVEKAAAKRYRLTRADLRNADKLNKVHAELQARCSTVPGTTTAEAPATKDAKSAKDAKGAKVAKNSGKQVAKAAAKAK